MKRFNPKSYESKWQEAWLENKIYAAADFSKKSKFVMLTEFPYPSGEGVHMGHVREYTLGDIIARKKRMDGMNVLYPMGWDAFGLPTENYAIKNKIAPQVATSKNIANFKKQFNSLGFSFDWDREINTTDPSYYKWTQWLFLQFFKAGLAYQDEVAINWCPFCKTGLANEEVINGRHERCDSLVEKKLLKQWILKITKYADELIEGLKEVDYPSMVADQQINWIGKSSGANVIFDVEESNQKIEIFTTAHDTIYGCTFMVLAPEHPLVSKITKKDHLDKVNSYIKTALSKSEIERQDEGKEKTGVFTGSYVINPLNSKKVPIYVADYVLAGYGTGAIMAVPGADKRDYEFAKKFDLEIIYITEENEFVDYSKEIKPNKKKFILANSDEFNGLNFEAGREAILNKIEKLKVGEAKVQYKIHDWIFSRQHYWGEPIPIIHCSDHGAVPVPEEDLPLELPKVENYEPTDTGESPLSNIDSWVNTTCPVCKKPAKRETDTMPNWAGSSWYYLRYFDAHNDKEFASKDKLDYWGMVDFYLGGMEHTTLHLLYSRFWHQFFYDQKLVPTKEPYHSRRGQGIILAADGTKMSKSKGNVVNPNDIIEGGYGADSMRLAISFLAPYDQTTPWSSESVVGAYRYLDRVWRLVIEYTEAKKDAENKNNELTKALNKVINKVTLDLNDLSFNTAIAALMEFNNKLYKIKDQDKFASREWKECIEAYLRLLAPFAPHVTEELWHELGNKDSIHLQNWPKAKDEIKDEEIKLVVQINGKLRDVLIAKLDISEDEAKELAMKSEKIKNYLKEADIKKVIYVKNRLVNFVV